MRIRHVGKMTAVLGLSALLMTGCGLFGPAKETGAIDPPQPSEVKVQGDQANATNNPTANGEATDEVKATAERTVYLLDANGYVVPVSLTLPKEEGSAKQVIQYMIKGGPVESMLPSGFQAVLPEGTKVLGMSVKDGTATVDFSPEFKNYKPEQEKKIVDAITRALTEFSSIKNVTIWVNGTPLTEMPVNNLPISSTLGRANGVNIELADNAIPGKTTPVTIYFQGQLDDKRTYYVPVTRFIPQTDNIAKAVVEELIKGPKEGSPLFSSLLSTTKLLNIEEKEGTVVVNLSDDVLKYDKGKEANPEALESLVLSLTENTGLKKVQVMVEGKPLSGSDYSNPVTRPQQINAIQF